MKILCPRNWQTIFSFLPKKKTQKNIFLNKIPVIPDWANSITRVFA